MHFHQHGLCVLLLLLGLSTTSMHGFSHQFDYWKRSAKQDREKLTDRLKRMDWSSPRNIIIFLGDGMGVSTVTGARLFASEPVNGQIKDLLGEAKLSMEDFTYSGLLRTFSMDSIVTDSAASATAYLTGVKTNNNYVGYTADLGRDDICKVDVEEASSEYTGQSILDLAHSLGYKTGFLTTTRVTHATPAGLYAQVPVRQWESDTDIERNSPGIQTDCKDIAMQLIDKGHLFNFIGGGGRRMFSPKYRKDGRDLIEELGKLHNSRGNSFEYYNTTDGDPSKTLPDYTMMLVNDDNLAYAYEKDKENLETLTRRAIDYLVKQTHGSKRGFVLFIEGGRIDHGHHVNQPRLALDETLSMDRTIRNSLDQLASDADKTLVIVTADHSHGFTINLGSRTESLFETTPCTQCLNSQNVKKIGYFSGPGSGSNIGQFTESFQPFLPTILGLHSGEDVPIFARGPMAQLFLGVHDNTYLAHTVHEIMNYSTQPMVTMSIVLISIITNGILYLRN